MISASKVYFETKYAAWFLIPSRSMALIIPDAAWERGVYILSLWYLRFHTSYEVGTYTKLTPLQKNTIDDVITSITWYGYNLQTRKKENLMPYLQVHHSCFLQSLDILAYILSDILAWQVNYMKDLIMTVT